MNTAITNAQLKYMEDRKSPPIATLFSFFISGAGQIYNGQTNKGIAMIVAYLALWATSFLILPILFLFFLWVWAMIDANEEAHKFNKALKQKLDEEAASIQSETKRQEKIRASTVTSNDFVNQIDKYFKLFQSSLLSGAEFEAKKKEILIDLTTKKLSEAPEDFLTAVIPLIQKKALTEEEIGQVKMAVL